MSGALHPQAPAADLDGLRRVHLGMIEAVLAGGGAARVAALAAERLGGVVAIVLPGTQIAVVAPRSAQAQLDAARGYVADVLLGRPTEVPPSLVTEAPVASGDDRLGSVLLLDATPAPDAGEVLALAALAVLTVHAVEQGPDQRRRRSAATLLEEVRAEPALPADELITRARHLGAELANGASALCVRLAPGGAEHVLAAIAQEAPGALAAPRGDLVHALLPAGAPAGRLGRRLARSGAVGCSPVALDAGALGRALAAAELALAIVERAGVGHEELLAGSWRLLIRLATGDAAELDALVESALGAALVHDRSSPASLVETLRAYLDHGANMNATAAAIYAHRHTIAYRLERVRELTGHDPQTPSGQEQLALGLKALVLRDAAAAAGSAP